MFRISTSSEKGDIETHIFYCCISGQLGNILHDPEVGLHLISQPSHVAKLGDQRDQLDYICLLRSLFLGPADKTSAAWDP